MEQKINFDNFYFSDEDVVESQQANQDKRCMLVAKRGKKQYLAAHKLEKEETEIDKVKLDLNLSKKEVQELERKTVITFTFGDFDEDEALLKEACGVSFHLKEEPKQACGKTVEKQKKKKATGPKGDQPTSPENKSDVKVKKEAVTNSILERQKKLILDLTLLLEQSKKELEEKSSQLEDKLLQEAETNFILQSLKEESTSLKVLVNELHREFQIQKTQWAEEKAALLLEKKQISATLQQQQTAIAEAEKNISIKDEELKGKVFLMDEQKSKISSMASNLWLVEDKLKSRTKQFDKLLKDNGDIIKQVKLTAQAHCFLKNQVQEKVTQLERALAKAENDLDAKNVKMEQERFCHTQTMSTLEAALAQTQQALKNLQAKVRQQKHSLPTSTVTRKTSLPQRIRSWFTPQNKQ